MKAKKLFAVLMAAAVLTGTTAASAVSTYAATITVDGLDNGATFKYLQVVEPDTTSTLGWKFVDGYEYEFMTAFGAATKEEALQDLIALGGDNNAANGVLHTSAELAAALTSLTDEVATDGTDGAGAVADVSTAGLYVIAATTTDATYTYAPMMAYVGDTGEGTLIDATVIAKGTHNVIDKNLSGENSSDNESVSAGDVVEFTATVAYPYYTADAAEKTFKVTDKLTNGTFVADSVTVSIAGEDEAPAYTTNAYADTNTLELNFSEGYDSKFAGKILTITYKATVGKGEGDVVNNITTNIDEEGDSVTLDKVKVKVLKRAEGGKALTGAEFEIYEASAEEKEGFELKENVSVVKPGGPLLDDQDLYLKQVDETRITEGNEGSLTFVGLDSQKTYYVKETKAPTGYTVNPNYYLVSGSERDENNSTDDVYVFTDFNDITVDDSKLSALPSTGGIGTTIFTIGGCVIMVTAAGLYFATRKKEEK